MLNFYTQVIFEGCDKTGKSSLIKNLHKVTDFRYCCIDRSFISHYVYEMARVADHIKRIINTEEHNIQLRSDKIGAFIDYVEKLNPCVIVNVVAKNEVIQDRIIIGQHEKVNIESSIHGFKAALELIKIVNKRVQIIQIDTSTKTLRESTNELKHKLEEIFHA